MRNSWGAVSASDPRFDAVERLITELAVGNFSARGDLSGSGDQIDAIVAGLNMLAEDLASGEASRRRAEQLNELNVRLDAGRARMEAVLHQLPAVVWTVGRHDEITELYGSGVARFTAHPEPNVLQELLGNGPEGEALVRGHRAAAKGETQRLDVERGEHVWSVSVEPLPGGGCVGVAVDVTETRAEAARREHAQKLESLGVLAGGIAHDFNNLLVGILGNASVLVGAPELKVETRRTLQQIETAAKRASELTRQLLAYSGKGRFLIRSHDLSAVVSEMLDLLRMSVAKTARLSTHFDGDLLPVEADVTQLRQVVMNLITNASDAVEGMSDGRIEIRTGTVGLSDHELVADETLDELPGGDYVYVAIRDNGRGMTPAQQRRMFEPFFSTKAPGRGLGMAAVLGIVRGHSGALLVDSAPDAGTEVRVLLPVADAPLHDPDASFPNQIGSASDRVLVVDDEELVRDVARRVLESAGYTVHTAVDGVEAMEVWSRRPDRYRLVILDMTMPRMGGAETYEAMAAEQPDVLVLLTSGYNEQDATNRFAGSGPAAFLPKPWTADELLGQVAELLRPEDD